MNPQRGEIWEATIGSRLHRVLIITSTIHNEQPTARPWTLAIDRNTTANVPGHLIPLGAADPLPGASIIIPYVIRVDRSGLRRSLGPLHPDTMYAVDRALRALLTLP